ncbi:winged helix-turn-helix domain-containing protein [Paenibacillus arenilitoris]|uniref:YcaQ family DNA glycosylase n=1 Tax=Paenibacillus arenilitoris TaxID=2772299 RepID=A0A927CIL2_9BACL|nr:crosslink repair DNA glycosylase YcaQ family protein [Paenibacillus arenilitoris]MBD2868769.1 YcaQ family DNA glycosylase [Paenibacillus arenilitoris]
MNTVKTTKRALRRFLLERQALLHPPEDRPASAEALSRRVLDMIRHLECVQIDPVSAVRPNQHLTLAARIGGYEPGILNELLRGGELFEYIANAACVIPMEDYPVFEPTRLLMKRKLQPYIDQIRPVAEQVLKRLEDEGPLPAKSFDSDQRVHGYWDNVNAKTKATSHALNLMMDAAQIRIVGREGNQRLFAVTGRSVPAELLRQAESIGRAEALEAMLQKYFRAYRVFEPGDPRLGWQRLSAKERREAIERRLLAGEIAKVEVEGLNKPYYMLASDRDRLAAQEDAAGKETEGTVRFLPPLDNLLWSRSRLEDLFGFEYRWEIYTPAVKRKYGYYAMPILAGDRLIGRMDPRLDAKQGHLTVQLLQIDPEVDYADGLRESVHRALESFARAHGADTVSIALSVIG